TVAGGTVFFVANDGVYGRELWKTDGSEAGTVRITDVLPDGCSGEIEDLTAVGDRLFFQARRKAPAGEGEELWISDGTTAGTHLVEDIQPGPEGSHPRDLVDANGILLFTAIDGESGRELWRSDGTEAGTTRVKDIFAGNAGSLDTSPLYVFDRRVVFA